MRYRKRDTERERHTHIYIDGDREFTGTINTGNFLHQYTVNHNKSQKMINAVLNHTTKFHYVNRIRYCSYDIKCKVYTGTQLVRAALLSLIMAFTFSHPRAVIA